MPHSTRWLRAEGLALLLAALAGYALADASWLLFAVLLLVPDLGMAGYLVSPRVGAITYNAVHVHAWPALLLTLWAAGLAPWALAPALIWLAHIGMDRALGYGLKEPDAFQHTHLGWIGGGATTAPTATVGES